MKYIILLTITLSGLAQSPINNSRDEVSRYISRNFIDITNFAKGGIEVITPFGETMSDYWFETSMFPNEKRFNHFIDKPLRSEIIENNHVFTSVAKFFNPHSDHILTIVGKSVDRKGNGKDRFLIQIQPMDSLEIGFTGINPTYTVEFYSIEPFEMEWFHIGNGKSNFFKTELPEFSIREEVEGNKCTADWDERGYCTNFRFGNPHCIRILNKSNNKATIAALHGWYECPDGETRHDEMSQYLQIYWPTKTDVYHDAIQDDPGYQPDRCNPEVNVWDLSKNKTYTRAQWPGVEGEPCQPEERIVEWNYFYDMAINGKELTGTVLVGCNSGLNFGVKKHFTCFESD